VLSGEFIHGDSILVNVGEDGEIVLVKAEVAEAVPEPSV